MTSWRHQAACAGTDPEAFFPISETGTNPADATLIADAKTLCRTQCPVIAECLDWALQAHCVHGVWGGTSGEERARILRGGRKPGALPVDPDQVAAVVRLTEQGLSAADIGRQLGMVPRVVVRYRARARQAAAQ